MTWLKKPKKERQIIILGTGPGGELCPFDRETWAVAKLLMSGKPQWKIDRMFNLDDINVMLSIYAERTAEELMAKVAEVEKRELDLAQYLKANYEVFKKKLTNRDEEQILTEVGNKTARLTEDLHNSLTDLTKIKEGLQFQAKFTKEDFIKRINDRKVPYITQKYYPEIPLSQPFPLKEIVNRFGTPYFSNTICYMIALAIYEGVTAIQLWGIVQGGYQEYLRERKGVEYWLGLACGLGIKIDVRGITQLFTNDDNGRLYGYKRTYDELLKILP